MPHSHFQLVFFGCSTSLADNDGLVTQSLMDPLTLHFAVASEKSKRSRGHGWVFLVTPNWWSLHLKEKEIGRWNRSGYLDGSYSKVTWGEEVILLDFEDRGKGGNAPERAWVWLTYCGQPARHCLGKYTATALIRRSLFIVLLISKRCLVWETSQQIAFHKIHWIQTNVIKTLCKSPPTVIHTDFTV